MTQKEVMTYIGNKPEMEHCIAGVWKNIKYYEKTPNRETLVVLFFDNSRGHEDEFLIQSMSNGTQIRNKKYNLAKLTPQLLDYIVDEVMADMYGKTKQDVLKNKEKKKLKSLNEDFE